MSTGRGHRRRLAEVAFKGAEDALTREVEGQHVKIERVTDEPLVRQWRVKLEDGRPPRYYLMRFSEPI